MSVWSILYKFWSEHLSSMELSLHKGWNGKRSMQILGFRVASILQYQYCSCQSLLLPVLLYKKSASSVSCHVRALFCWTSDLSSDVGRLVITINFSIITKSHLKTPYIMSSNKMSLVTLQRAVFHWRESKRIPSSKKLHRSWSKYRRIRRIK